MLNVDNILLDYFTSTLFSGLRGLLAEGDLKEREDCKPSWVCHLQLESGRRCRQAGPAGKKTSSPPLSPLRFAKLQLD